MAAFKAEEFGGAAHVVASGLDGELSQVNLPQPRKIREDIRAIQDLVWKEALLAVQAIEQFDSDAAFQSASPTFPNGCHICEVEIDPDTGKVDIVSYRVLDDFGRPPNTHGNGALYARILPSENASKPAGEWQTYEITLIANHVTVIMNGTKIIDNGEVPGITGGALDANEKGPGPIMLQGDHGKVQFRKVRLTPLY